MMNRTDIEAKVITCLEDIVPSTVTVERDTDLLKLGINSMTFIRLVVSLEEALEIEIQDDSIYLDNFKSVSQICNLVEQYVS